MGLYLKGNKISPIIKEEPNLGTKSITANGTYNASSDNLDGYSEVNVNVSSNDLNNLFKKTITSLPENVFDGVERIESHTFYNCTDLVTSNLILPNSLTFIGDYSFRYTKIGGKVVIPDSVTEIGQYAFQGCMYVEEFIIGSGLSNYSYNQTFNPSFNRYTVINCKRAIVRRTQSIPTLNNKSIFGGDQGVEDQSQFFPIFVHNSIIAQVVVATNWSFYASQGRVLPWVNTVADLSNIDTTTYTKACVMIDSQNYQEYTYDGSQWNEVV